MTNCQAFDSIKTKLINFEELLFVSLEKASFRIMRKVLKFGGSSVGSPDAARRVMEILREIDEPAIVVVSALKGVTDRLYHTAKEAANGNPDYRECINAIDSDHQNMCKELTGNSCGGDYEQIIQELKQICSGVFLLREASPKSLDFIASAGERLSSCLLYQYLKQEKLDISLCDSRKVIRTDSDFGNATVDFATTREQFQEVAIRDTSRFKLFQGFIGATIDDEVTTLGRGGSDYSGAILAEVSDADQLEIWTDVHGLMTADPRIVKNAKVIDAISYQEAIELSHFGAKVLYAPSIQPCLLAGKPIIIKNTFHPEEKGTYISNEVGSSAQIVRGITSLKNVSLINFTGAGLVSIPTFTSEFFSVLSKNSLSVLFITQSNASHSLTVAMHELDAELAVDVLNEAFQEHIRNKLIDPIKSERDLSLLALVGSGMKDQVGISGSMFNVLGRNGVSIKAISQGSSERNISAVIRRSDLEKSLNILHEAFFLNEAKRVNLFIIGVGNVGKAFLEQLTKQFSYLKKQHNINLKVIGVANSRKMAFVKDGIPLSKWKEHLDEGGQFSKSGFTTQMFEYNLRNSIFVDITASSEIAGLYLPVLRKSISVVSPNKIAATESFKEYLELKSAARTFRSQFLIETNVCAGLPILSTLSDIVKSGDTVHSIEAVLSGTLNFLFNEYDATAPFFEIIQKAKEEGYTEPDPRLDLSGEDVKRKLLILIRESGYPFEMEQIKMQSFLPESCADSSSLEDFYDKVAAEEAYFKKLYESCAEKNCRLKVVASYREGNATVSLKEMPADHPFYNLEGKDNIVLFNTERYKEQPLVIKGAGAGAEVTASGVFADVLRLTQPD
ncbi:MAG: bifunctional aspartate kinase/homoserine dehydrogenase I [Bacteroidota bacterium]